MKLIYAEIYEFSNLRALCLLWIRTHLGSPSDSSVFLKSRLEDIRGNPLGLWHLSTYWLCPFTRDPAAHSFLPSCSTLVVTASSGRTFVKTDAGSAAVTGAAVCLWRDSSTIRFLKEVRGKDNPAIVIEFSFGSCCHRGLFTYNSVAGLISLVRGRLVYRGFRTVSALLRIRLGKREAFTMRSYAKHFVCCPKNVHMWGVLILRTANAWWKAASNVSSESPDAENASYKSLFTCKVCSRLHTVTDIYQKMPTKLPIAAVQSFISAPTG